ncbi:hypothetical protein N9N67_12220 [Bacteriovoracaceae bacterium]|nr:hypothetical protein [Bacteriovoracaceae bacterium]
MGDAYTSYATDEYTLFYNPALMARHSGFSFTPMNLSLQGTNPIGATEETSGDVGTDPADVAESYMNFPIHINLGITPTIKMGKFGLSAFATDNTNLLLTNQINPTFEIDYRNDRGFVMGYASPVKGTISKDSANAVSLGVGVKYIERRGIYSAYPIASAALLNALEGSTTSEIFDSLGSTGGKGWGLDFGVDYLARGGGTEFGASFAAMDILTNIVTTEENTADPTLGVLQQRLDVNLGTHFKQDLGPLLHYAVTADIRSLNDATMPFMRRFHAGLEVGIPGIQVFGGMNSGYYSYGLRSDFLIIDLFVGFYNVELGSGYQDTQGKRFVFYMSLFDFTFDT